MARHLKFWDYDRSAEITCPHCGWTGLPSDHEEVHAELLDVCCGSCDAMLLIVPFPTFDETRAAAGEGNERAIENLGAMEAQEARYLWRQAQPHLRETGQLPDLPGESLLILWDQETNDGEQWQTLLHDGVEIWREPAYYESIDRFRKVFEILRERYGTRLAEVRPTETSEFWLYGDRISALSVPTRLNASLRSADDH